MDYIVISAAVLPVILLMIFIYRQDKYQKEPVKVLAKAFLGGILAIPLDLMLVWVINMTYYSDTVFYSAFIEAGLCEELCKFAFLFLFIWRNKAFDEYMDGIVYATFVSLGFACIENIMYITQYGIEIAFSRGILSVPGHFLFGVIMGYFFSLAKFNRNNKLFYLLMAILVPSIAHGLFDWLLMIQEHLSESLSGILYLLFISGDFLLWKIDIKYIRKHQLLTQNQSHETATADFSDDFSPFSNADPEYKHIDWNAGEKR